MKIANPLRKYLFAVALFVSLYGSPHAARAQAQERGLGINPQAGGYYALVIGNNAYQYVQRLKTAEADAKEIDNILRTQYGFQTKLLLNATRGQILSAINSYRRELSAEANLLIYYAGHGINDKDIDKAYWLPVDARLDDNSNWISADDITSNIKGVPAKHVLIVSDSCYSGTLTRGLEASLPAPSERQRYLQKMWAGKSRTLMASGGNEPVADGGGGNHSIFANALLRGLAQMERDEFTAGELFREFIEESVGGRANQTPEYNPLRNSGHENGDFIFNKVGAGRRTTTAGETTTTTPSAPANVSSVDPAAVELSFWESIKNSSDPQDFRDYLDKYPNGTFANLARRRTAPTGKRPAGNLPAGNAPAGNAATSNTTGEPTGERAATGAMRGVRDYYYSLPEQYLDVPANLRAGLLQRADAILDVKNGYLSVRFVRNGSPGRYVLTVFRRSDDSFLVGLTHTRPDARADAKLLFLRYKDDQWNDVTDEVLPVAFDPTLNYELPRVGTTIAVTNRAGAKVYDLLWAKGRFLLNRER